MAEDHEARYQMGTVILCLSLIFILGSHGVVIGPTQETRNNIVKQRLPYTTARTRTRLCDLVILQTTSLCADSGHDGLNLLKVVYRRRKSRRWRKKRRVILVDYEEDYDDYADDTDYPVKYDSEEEEDYDLVFGNDKNKKSSDEKKPDDHEKTNTTKSEKPKGAENKVKSTKVDKKAKPDTKIDNKPKDKKVTSEKSDKPKETKNKVEPAKIKPTKAAKKGKSKRGANPTGKNAAKKTKNKKNDKPKEMAKKRKPETKTTKKSSGLKGSESIENGTTKAPAAGNSTSKDKPTEGKSNDAKETTTKPRETLTDRFKSGIKGARRLGNINFKPVIIIKTNEKGNYKENNKRISPNSRVMPGYMGRFRDTDNRNNAYTIHRRHRYRTKNLRKPDRPNHIHLHVDPDNDIHKNIPFYPSPLSPLNMNLAAHNVHVKPANLGTGIQKNINAIVPVKLNGNKFDPRPILSGIQGSDVGPHDDDDHVDVTDDYDDENDYYDAESDKADPAMNFLVKKIRLMFPNGKESSKTKMLPVGRYNDGGKEIVLVEKTSERKANGNPRLAKATDTIGCVPSYNAQVFPAFTEYVTFRGKEVSPEKTRVIGEHSAYFLRRLANGMKYNSELAVEYVSDTCRCIEEIAVKPVNIGIQLGRAMVTEFIIQVRDSIGRWKNLNHEDGRIKTFRVDIRQGLRRTKRVNLHRNIYTMALRIFPQKWYRLPWFQMTLVLCY